MEMEEVTWVLLGPRTAWRLYSAGEVLVGPQMAEVLCDFCNTEIYIRPVPVWGSYALCPKCFADLFGENIVNAAARKRIALVNLTPGKVALLEENGVQQQWTIHRPLWDEQYRHGDKGVVIPVEVRRGTQKRLAFAWFHEDMGFMGWTSQKPHPKS